MRSALASVVLLGAYIAQAHAQSALPPLYTLHCSGCHGEDGAGVPSKGIPNLRDAGYYAAIPLGRRYLIEVPGLSQSTLNDDQVAQMLNYILKRFSADPLPRSFTAFSAGEVTRYRNDAASDAPARRQAVFMQLRSQPASP